MIEEFHDSRARTERVDRVWRGPRVWLVVLRDLAGLCLGGWGYVHEVLSPTPRETLLWISAIMVVAPGALAAHWLGRTESPSSPARPESSPSSPSSPSSTS